MTDLPLNDDKEVPLLLRVLDELTQEGSAPPFAFAWLEEGDIRSLNHIRFELRKAARIV